MVRPLKPDEWPFATDEERAAGWREPRFDRRKKVDRRLSELPQEPDPDENVWKMLDGPTAWADALTGEHSPHRGNHIDYACGFSGPHCWECHEPWPCRTERGVTIGPEPPQEPERPTP